MGHPDGAMLVSRLVAPPRAAAGRALRRAAWDWAGLPSGPLGWVSSHTVLASAPVVYQNVARACQLRPDDELLDVGCGSGGFLAQQAGHVQRVAGIDLSEIQVDLARRRLGERIAAGTAEIVRGDAGALPWSDASFTVATCMQVFETFPDPQQVLAEVFRVLRPGGRAVLNIGERVDPGMQTHRIWGEFWVWAEDDVRRMVKQAGFTDVTTQYVAWGGNNPAEKLFGRLVGPIGGDLRLVHGLKA